MRTQSLFSGTIAVPAMLVSFNSAALQSVMADFGELVGEEDYVYGFPLVMMDVTREVLTATHMTGEHSAPINQFARMRSYVSPDYKNVVRMSVNSLWSFAFLDLGEEPMVVSDVGCGEARTAPNAAASTAPNASFPTSSTISHPP